MTNYQSVFTFHSSQQLMHGSPISRLGLICTVNVSSWPLHRSDEYGFPAEILRRKNVSAFYRKISAGTGVHGSLFRQKKKVQQFFVGNWTSVGISVWYVTRFFQMKYYATHIKLTHKGTVHSARGKSNHIFNIKFAL